MVDKLRIEQIWQLAKVDFTKRYYGSQLGLLWAVLEPLISLAIYYFAFAFLIYRNEDPLFAAYLYLGIITMKFFRATTNRSIQLLNQKKYLIENIPFKRFDIFLALVITESISFFLSIAMFVVFALFLDVEFSLLIFQFLPVFLQLVFISLGIGMTLASISVFFRDINFVWDLSGVLLMWTSPIIIPEEVFFERVPWLIYVNPLFALICNVRSPLLYNSSIDWNYFLISTVFGLVFFGIGYLGIKNYSYKIIER